MKKLVSRRSVVERLNRVLAKRKQRLRSINRRTGTYVRVDTAKGTVLEDPVNLSKMAHDLGVLKPWERFVEDV